LVVEDADELREMLVLLLENDGFVVKSCARADEALAAIRSERPDLVLTDLMLGPTSGLDLITHVASDLAPPLPPIVACSGFTQFEDEALRRGAVEFIPKPFHPGTIEKTVAAVLARRELSEAERAQATAQARSRRARAGEDARAALDRLAPRRADLMERSQWTTSFIPRYFGFGEAFIAVLQGTELRIFASSTDRPWKRDQAVDIKMCQDILESSSSVVVPDLPGLGSVVRGPNGKLLRFFAGVPLSSGASTVGALCVVDTESRSLAPDDYSILAAFGRRSSVLLSNPESASDPIWGPSGFLAPGSLELVLIAALKRLEREGTRLSLLVVESTAPDAPSCERVAIGELGERRFGILAAESEAEPGRRLAVLGASAKATLRGGGMVDIQEAVASGLEARGIIRVAERLLDVALSKQLATIERIVVRREPSASR
jgi:CheY-like chemotaxis protein